MPPVALNASNFKGAYSHLNGSTTPALSKLKCIKFAKTVGISHYARPFGRTQTALAMAAYRAMAVKCVLDFGQANLTPHSQYAQLESSEKTNLSYWIGMAFTAFAADKILGIPRTIHALQGGHTIKKAKASSKSLADLIGQDAAGDWHVLEAKGRQRNPSPADTLAWKTQAKTITSINKTVVSTTSYCVGMLTSPCRIDLVDPPIPPQPPIDLTVDPSDFGRGYYQPYHDFLRQDSTSVSRQFRSFKIKPIMFDPIDQVYIFVGLESVYQNLVSADSQFRFRVDEIAESDFYCASDGIVVASHQSPCGFEN